MPEQDETMIISLVIGLVVIFVVVFVLGLLCGLFGLVIATPQQAGFLENIAALRLG